MATDTNDEVVDAKTGPTETTDEVVAAERERQKRLVKS